MKELYNKVSLKTSRITTHEYSTSFSIGIRLFNRKYHDPIYAIYGFVRLADEIVDSFHDHDKRALLEQFKSDTWEAIRQGISTNPILHSFQWVVRKYHIDISSIETFLKSMEMDLDEVSYDNTGYKDYILGSAEVVGLMCLRVFTDGDHKKYDELKEYAMALGSAFQKINFLRDLKDDYYALGRTYFPDVDISTFDDSIKTSLELDIQKDFDKGFEGIKKLPKSVRLGVWVAYRYYLALFKKIRRTNANVILNNRVRIPNIQKYFLLFRTYVKYQIYS
jgi:phytoene/squalene synthetase